MHPTAAGRLPGAQDRDHIPSTGPIGSGLTRYFQFLLNISEIRN
jgi:hypothetical protein